MFFGRGFKLPLLSVHVSLLGCVCECVQAFLPQSCWTWRGMCLASLEEKTQKEISI